MQLEGYATGGVAFGYLLRKALGPDGEPVGSKIEVNADQAVVVRRIFASYSTASPSLASPRC
jgi:hypothetical protein